MTNNKSEWVILVAIGMMILSSLACTGDGDGTVIPTPVNVGDDTATEVVQQVRIASEKAEDALDALNELNCKLGLDSCNE